MTKKRFHESNPNSPTASILMSKISSGVTWKSIAVAVILIPFNFYWIISGEVGIVGYALNTYAVPFYNVVFSVFALVLLNFVLQRVSGVSIFDGAELLTIYILLSVACALPSITLMTILVTTIGHAFWYASPENEWQQLFWNHLPNWLVVKDRSVLSGYYEGESTLYTISHIRAWLQPAMYWTIFITCLLFVMLCINVILRKRWIEREHLAYPVTQIAYQLTCNTNRLFSNRMVWIGFAISASIAIINGLGFLFPAIPTIPVKRVGSWQGFGHLFTEKPWNAIGGISMSFYPFVIGLGFLMPLDLAFSGWFFFIFYKMELVLTSALGINAPGFPYVNEQCFGAAVGLCLSLLIYSRRYLMDVLKTAVKGMSTEDRDEPVRYRFALLGIILGVAFLFVFSIRIGMSLWLIPVFFGIYLTIVLVITRMRAEQGFPVHAMENMSTHNVLVSSIGTRVLTNNLIGMSLYRWFNRSFTSNPVPHQMEGFKLADRSGINTKRLFYSLIGITALGSISVFWVMLHLFYKVGASSGGGGGWSEGFGWRVFNGLQSWLYYPTEPNYYAIGGIAFGLLFSLVLTSMRSRFLWWPFHPIGFVICSDWGMRYLWSCMLVSSVVKWGVLRFGGRRAAQQLVMLAIGLMLGDFTVGGLWSLLGVFTKTPMYNFWP